MTDITDDEIREFELTLASMATGFAQRVGKARGRKLYGMVEKEIALADVAFGIWRDHTAPNGYGVLLVKGDRDLEKIQRGPAELITFAFPCVDEADATAWRQRYLVSRPESLQ